MHPTESAYIAGFFDGEGSVVITGRGRGKGRPNNGRLDLTVSIVNTDHDVIQMIRASAGSGFVTTRNRKGSLGRKTLYVVQWSGRAAEAFLQEIYPYLRVKKGKAEVALRFRETFNRRHCGAGLPASVAAQREAARISIKES